MDETPQEPASKPEAEAQPEPKRRGSIRKRLAAYAVILVLGAVGASAALARDPQDEVDALAQVIIENPTRRLFYRYRGASLGLYGKHGYSLTLYVGSSSRFRPARFLIVSRLDGVLRGELMVRKGAEGVTQLTGARLDDYLERSRLDLSGIERAYATWLAQQPSTKR